MIKEETNEWLNSLDPYFLSLGKLTYSWNRLQDAAATLFRALLRPLPGSVALGMWNSLLSDRSQLELLLSAARGRSDEDEFAATFPRASADIEWLAERIINLIDDRNNALHAHMAIAITDNSTLSPIPWDALGNERASKLAKKLGDGDIVDELNWYRAKANTYTRYAERMRDRLSWPVSHTPDGAWPDRPLVPTREEIRRKGESIHL